jgi:hypothetical protein
MFDNGAGSNSANNTFFRGTLYAPTAAVRVIVHNTDDTIFGRGVVVGTLDVTINASSKQVDAPFSLPSAQRERVVLFTATVAGESSPRLRARVRYIDKLVDAADGTTTTVLPGRIVSVEEWTVLR